MTAKDTKPTVQDRVAAWVYAYGSITSATGGSEHPVPPGEAAIAAAILTVGYVNITDPMLRQVADLMLLGNDTARKENA